MDELGTLRTGLFVGSGVMALGALGFYFLERPSNRDVLAPDPPKRAGDIDVSPMVGADAFGLEMMFVFE